MNVRNFITAVIAILLLAVFWGMGKRIVQPPEEGSTGATSHHENAALLNTDGLSVEVASKAPLTSDSAGSRSSIDSEEAKELLNQSTSPIPKDPAKQPDSLQGLDLYAE